MNNLTKNFFFTFTLLLLLFIPFTTRAQMVGHLETPQGARFSASAATSYQSKSDVNGGGDLSVSRYSLMIGGSAPVTDKIVAGVGFTYDFEDYDFSNLRGFAVSKPWDEIDRVGVGGRLSYRLGEHWSVHAGPVIQYAGERGADFGDSLLYGGIVSASYRASRNFLIGFGAGAFYRLEETRVFPSLVFSWKITDRLRLGNSYRLGLAGPAGLELTYSLDKNWELGVGGGYRSFRFRLDKNGPIPSGIGENTSWPAYVRLGGKLWPPLNIDIFAGAAFSGKLKLENRSGHELSSASYDTTPMVGLNLSASF